MKKKITVQRYQKSDFSRWNSFVNEAKNSTFLFHRDFMEYHADRFEDFSLLLLDENQNITAVLPANIVGKTLYSHQGLTYGGLILKFDIQLFEVINLTLSLLLYLFENQIYKLYLKQLPVFYSKTPTDEMEYISYLLNAKLVRRDSLSVINLDSKVSYNYGRKRSVKRGIDNNLICVQENTFEEFWNNILIPNLKIKHNAMPVHSLEEITLLKSKFPNNIKQFNVYKDGEIVAGTTMFIYDNVAKPQYISGNFQKNKIGSIDFLYDFLLKEFQNKSYFDFGPSNVDEGKKVVEGILFWKESFGARTYVQNFYEIETKNYSLLEQVLI